MNWETLDQDESQEMRKHLRETIQKIDDQMVDLTEERSEAALAMVENKIRSGDAIYQGKQEQLKLQNLDDDLKERGVDDFTRHVERTSLQRRIDASRELQYARFYELYKDAFLATGETMKNPFLTLFNTEDRHQEALKAHDFLEERYDYPLGKAIAEGMRDWPYATDRIAVHSALGIGADEVVRKIWPKAHVQLDAQPCNVLEDVEEEKVDVGILTLTRNFRALDLVDRLRKRGLYIAESFTMERDYQLMHHPDVDLAEIRTVIAEPYLLEELAPKFRKLGWKIRTTWNSEEAIREIRDLQDPSCAVILNEAEGKTFGFVTEESWSEFQVKRSIQFVAVTKKPHIAPDATNVAVSFTIANQIGGLVSALQSVGDFGFNIIRSLMDEVEGRPYQMRVLFEFEATPENEMMFPLLYQICQETLDTQFVGWFKKTTLS